MEGKKRKEKGGAEKARIKKKRMLEGDASNCSKIGINELCRWIDRKTVSQSSTIDVIARREPIC